MTFTPNDLQRLVLGIVDGLQHASERRDVVRNKEVVLDSDVPGLIIQAEMCRLGEAQHTDESICGTLRELTTRGLLMTGTTDDRDWTLIPAYVRPDGCVVRSGAFESARAVFLDDELVACDEAGAERASLLWSYTITSEGLELLDSSRTGPHGPGESTPADPGESTSAKELQPTPEEQLEQLPQLDTTSGDWVRQNRVAEMGGRSTATLRNDRYNGYKNSDGLSGVDKHGRMWRKVTRNAQTIWYFLKSIRSRG